MLKVLRCSLTAATCSSSNGSTGARGPLHGAACFIVRVSTGKESGNVYITTPQGRTLLRQEARHKNIKFMVNSPSVCGVFQHEPTGRTDSNRLTVCRLSARQIFSLTLFLLEIPPEKPRRDTHQAARRTAVFTF